MKKLTDDELQKAFTIWLNDYAARETEGVLAPFLNDQIKSYSHNQQGWLKTARKALFLSADTVASKLKVARSAYSKYEESEEKGVITLTTLARAAEAMNCELVYAIRPKNKKYFSQIIWEKLLPFAISHPWIKTCDQKRRGHGLAFIVKQLMNSPKFRRERGWSQRANMRN